MDNIWIIWWFPESWGFYPYGGFHSHGGDLKMLGLFHRKSQSKIGG